MSPPGAVLVITKDGLRGHIDTALWPLDGSKSEVLVQLDDGRQVMVPFGILSPQADGSYVLDLGSAELEHRSGAGGAVGEQPIVVPVMVEELDVHTRRLETGRVRINKVVHEREELVDEPLLREEVSIERVPVNRVVEETIPVRYEGDTLIVSLLEEVLVVEKRLLLKEELRITKRQVETHEPVRVRLRREEATIDHIEIDNDDKRQSL